VHEHDAQQERVPQSFLTYPAHIFFMFIQPLKTGR